MDLLSSYCVKLSARMFFFFFFFVPTLSTHVKPSKGKDEIKEKKGWVVLATVYKFRTVTVNTHHVF